MLVDDVAELGFAIQRHEEIGPLPPATAEEHLEEQVANRLMIEMGISKPNVDCVVGYVNRDGDSMMLMVTDHEQFPADHLWSSHGFPRPAVVVHTETFELYATDDVLLDQLMTHAEKVTGLARIVRDAGRFAAAARAANPPVPAPDESLAALRDRARALVIQAASLNLAPTALQTQVFAEHLAELREKVARHEDLLAEVHSAISLAEVAIIDAETTNPLP